LYFQFSLAKTFQLSAHHCCTAYST